MAGGHFHSLCEEEEFIKQLGLLGLLRTEMSSQGLWNVSIYWLMDIVHIHKLLYQKHLPYL